MPSSPQTILSFPIISPKLIIIRLCVGCGKGDDAWGGYAFAGALFDACTLGAERAREACGTQRRRVEKELNMSKRAAEIQKGQ